MNRTRACLLLFAAACLLAPAPEAQADDRDFLRRGTEAPLVFILFDTSSTMNYTTKCTAQQLANNECRQLCTSNDGNCFAPRNGDDPASKIYQAKEVLARVLQGVTDMNLAFASFNQDNLRVVQKHWLYRAVGGGVVLPAGTVQFPAIGATTGALEVFGAAWPCDTGNGDAQVACYGTAADAAVAGTPWEIERLHRLPKPGVSGQGATTVFVQSGNGANARRYKVTYSHVAGEVLGSASFNAEIDVAECTNADCTTSTDLFTDRRVSYELVGQFLSHEGEVTVQDTVTTNVEYRVFFDGSGAMLSGNAAGASDIRADVSSANNSPSCEGWEPNAWTTSDPSDPEFSSVANPDEDIADDRIPPDYNLRYPTTNLADPLGKHFFSGDVLPFDWEDDNKQAILDRLAPAGRFDTAFFFEDSDANGNGMLDLVNPLRRPLLAIGRGPLGEAIKDFRTWYAGCPQGNCNPRQGEVGWAHIAAARDPGFGCRKKYLVVITDGDESCGGGNSACNGTASLRAQEGIETYVVGFGVPGGGNILTCMPANGGTNKPLLPNNMAELEQVLTGIFLEIKEESRAFASAAVPSVEANVRDKIFLSDFTPLTQESVWDGHLDAFIKPLPLDPASGLPIDNPLEPGYRGCASFSNGCHLWDAGDVLKLQAPTLAQAQAGNFKLHLTNPDQRRVLYPDGSGVLRMFEPPAGNPDWIDLLEGFGFTDTSASPANKTRGTDIIENTLAIKSGRINFRDGTFQDITFVLGDVFHSDPVVGESARDFDDFANNLFSTGPDCDLSSSSDKGYQCFAFKTQNRRKLLIFGTNDAQLHALDAGTFSIDSDSNGSVDSFSNGTGREAFSFIPRMALPIVRDQAEGDRHIFGVDGPVTIADAWFPSDLEWHTLLVGGMREGGRLLGGGTVLVPESGVNAKPLETGYYALDITQPDPLREVTDSTGNVIRFEPTDVDPVPGCTSINGNPASDCPRPFPLRLWEFTDRSGATGRVLDEDANGYGDLADPWSKPVLTRIRLQGQDGSGNATTLTRFVVVVGGGVDPGAKTSPTPSGGNWIYILDAETGVPLYKRQVQGAVPSVAVLDSNEDSFADTIYAGTTTGLMYKVDISTPQPLEDVTVNDVGDPPNGIAPTPWDTQRVTAPEWEPFPIFQAPAGQPIYMQTQVLFVAKLGRFALVFGTGDREDLWTFGGSEGRLYVVVDDDFTPLTVGLPFDESLYHRVTPTAAALASATNLLLDPSGGTGSQKGWFMVLDPDERVITKAFGVSGILIFSSFQPQIFIETEGQGNNRTNICTRFGKSRNFVVFAFNANPVANLDENLATAVAAGPGPQPPGGEGLDRFLVLDDFVTSPFVEQAHTQNVTGDDPGGGSEVPTAESCTNDPRLGAISNILKTQGPSNARYGNYFLRLGQRMSKRGIFYPACVPIAVMQRNWREN